MSEIIRILKWILRIGFINTIIFNLHYFGIKGLIFPVIIGKNFELILMKGKVVLKSNKFASVKICMNEFGACPYKHTYGSFQNSGTIIFNGKNTLGTGTCISNSGVLSFGHHTSITAKSSIICAKKITLEDNVIVSWDCQIIDTDFHEIYSKNSTQPINPPKEILIKKHCWICAGSKILKGVTIASDTVIAANSCITKSNHESNVIICSNGIIKKDISWKQ